MISFLRFILDEIHVGLKVPAALSSLPRAYLPPSFHVMLLLVRNNTSIASNEPYDRRSKEIVLALILAIAFFVVVVVPQNANSLGHY